MAPYPPIGYPLANINPCFLQCCGSGFRSSRIGIILADLDPDWHLEPGTQIRSRIWLVSLSTKCPKYWNFWCLLALLWWKVQENFWFSSMCKTWGRLWIRIWIGIEMEIGSGAGSPSKQCQFTTLTLYFMSFKPFNKQVYVSFAYPQNITFLNEIS